VLLGALLAPTPCAGGAFSIFEQGARGMGFGGAFTAIADDPSAVFHNPAGLAFLEGRHVYFGATLLRPKSDFVGAGPYPGEGIIETTDIRTIPFGASYYTQQVSKTLAVGMGVYAPFGLEMKWANPDAYSGRFVSLEATLRSLSLNPTLAWRVTEHLSIAGGVDVRLSTVALRRRVPNVNPFTGAVVDIAEAALSSRPGVGWGWNGGVLVKPSAALALGASYRHKVRVDYRGSAAFHQISTHSDVLDRIVAASLPVGEPAVTTSIEFPAMATAGVATRRSGWTLAADAVWFQWSTFDRVDIRFAEYPHLDDAFIEDYVDSWQLRVGLERRLSDHWAVRGGYFYDQSPAPASSVSPLLPDASRNGYALGASWSRRAIVMDAAAWYIDFEERSTQGQSREDYNGTYRSSALTFSGSIRLRF
jgi:long-chain fatty acid transport protein